uniref:NADH-ubiquinone oxidoreductase chain 6 n=1 Tax=Hilsa kelee TaxID=529102 RepID=H1UCW1_9TELE|nr:NADH dehydrogenase subunit 6 [Hilsa kelee]
MSVFTASLYIGGILGYVAVAANPAPHYGAMGLLVAAAMNSALLAMHGYSFLALALFLIYLGGMMVVFAYAVSWSADEHPETWTEAGVYEYVALYILAVVVGALYVGPTCYGYGVEMLGSVKELMLLREDTAGVSLLYALGGAMMLGCAWVLFVTLFVVLEVVRGQSRGGMRI